MAKSDAPEQADAYREEDTAVRIVVREWERVLLYRQGRFAEQIGPGAHWRWGGQRLRADLRPRLLTVPAQEVLTADGISVKITVVARLRVAEPRTWFEAVADPDPFAYAAIQLALRQSLSSRSLEQVLATRAEMGAEMLTATAAQFSDLGLVADDMDLRDVVVPSELRHAAVEVAAARAKGQAALERSRGEVAANRALANAARLITDNPGLLQLRTLQAIETGGATVVLSHTPHAPSGVS